MRNLEQTGTETQHFHHSMTAGIVIRSMLGILVVVVVAVGVAAVLYGIVDATVIPVPLVNLMWHLPCACQHRCCWRFAAEERHSGTRVLQWKLIEP